MTSRKVPALDMSVADHVVPNRRDYLAAGIWSDERLGSRVSEIARSAPDREAVVDRKGQRRISFQELDELSNRFANWLVDVGLLEGDVIAVQLPNCLEAVVIAIGANKAGVVVNPMLTIYRANELRRMLGKARTKIIFAPDIYRGFDHQEMITAVTEGLEHDCRSVPIDVTEDDADGPQQWIEGLAGCASSPCERTTSAENVSVILFTSGTEGASKAVMHTEQTLNSNVSSVWRSFEMGESEIVWMPSPVGHSTGFNYGIRYALFHGAKLVLQDRWNAEAGVEIVEREKPTFTLAATVFLTDLLEIAKHRTVDLSSLRVFGCGGAAIPAVVVTEAAKHGVNVLRLYGQTEVLIATLNRPSSTVEERVETDGDAVDDYDVEIRDEEGNPVPAGTIGELCVIGPGNSVGYFDDREKTLIKFRSGWAHTADLAEMDANGNVTIHGRMSDMIIRGGLNIMPREIEEAVSTMDSVASVVVVGLPHERLGETCCACVVPDGDHAPTLEQVCAHLNELGFAAFKLPERIETFDELPTTASGKIQRFKIIEAITGDRA